MFLFWKIRYLDSRDREYKDRDLFLDTDTLDSSTKAAVEAVYELRDTGNTRGILQFRHLFYESQNVMADLSQLGQYPVSMSSFCIPDYFEDENGKEINSKEMAHILTGSANAVMFPAGTPAYRIRYVFSEKPPIHLDKLELTPALLNTFGYFARDLREMLTSTFYREGAGKLSGKFPEAMYLETSVTDEELRSFVTVFRRLYMQGEPYNFLKAVVAFGDVLHDHPLAQYISGIGCEYKVELEQPPKHVPYVGADKFPFTSKRLLDVHIYTLYAHQPCPKREKQYRECLASLCNSKPLLMWMFLSEMLKCIAHIRNAGMVIADFFNQYCQCHRLDPAILTSIATDHPGIGRLETKRKRQERILNEKAHDLAVSMWKEAGQPSGGPEQFTEAARNRLNETCGREIN